MPTTEYGVIVFIAIISSITMPCMFLWLFLSRTYNNDGSDPTKQTLAFPQLVEILKYTTIGGFVLIIAAIIGLLI